MKRTLGFALLFTIAYILIFSSPLRKEPVLKPVWVQNLAKPTAIASSSSTDTIAFRMGDIFGYTTPQGAIKYLNTAQFNVAMNNKRFINFSSVSETLVEKDTAGRIVQTIQSRGYPIFEGGRSFIISTDRTALSEVDSQGASVWSRDFGSLITSIGVNHSSVVVGLLNGSIALLDGRGKVAFRFTPTGSKLAVIYGCAISPDGDHIALVSGLEPQRFILLQRDKKGGYRPRLVTDLSTDMRHQVLLHFFGSDPYAYVEVPGAIRYFGVDSGLSGAVGVLGRVEALANAGSLLAALSSTGGGAQTGRSGEGGNSGLSSELTVFSPPGNVLLRNRFRGRNLYATAQGSALYLGVDNRLMRIDYTLE